FSASVFRPLDPYQIPVNRRCIAVWRFLITVAGSKMNGSGNLYVKKNIFHRLQDIGVDADGKFTDVSCSFVGIQYFIEPFRIVGRGIDDLSVPKLQAYLFIRKTVVKGRRIIGDPAVYRISYRSRVPLSVG